MLLVSGGWVVPDWPDIPWIVLVGLSGLSAHYTMAQALRVVDVSVAIPIDFLRVPLIAVIGWMFYGEAISIAVFVGASLIFGANYMAMRAEILYQTHSTDRRQE
jgi:S-adenosylmethionine uptake transporter